MRFPSPPAAVTRTFSSLEIRNYRYYFAGQSISMIGTWMQSTTQAWLVLQLTGSGAALGLVVALQTLPILVFGPIGGIIADRFGKYRILWWTQVLAGLQALALAVLDLSGHLQLWELYVIALSLGFVNMVDNPTRQTFIVEMVGRDELSNAVTLNSVMVNVARAIGPAVGGVLIATVGSGWCFLINAASFVFVLAGLHAIHQDELMPAPRAERQKGQVTEGFRYVARTPVLRDALIMMAIIGMLAYEFQVSIPLMAVQVFHGGSTLYGVLNSAQGIGAVVGGLIVAGRPRTGSRRLVQTATAFGVVMLLAAVAPTAVFEVGALLLVGAASVTFLALGNTTLQLSAEPAMRGRVMSLWSVAFLGSTPVGGPVVGLVAGALGARFGLGLGAVAIAVAVGFGWWSLRRRAADTANATDPTFSLPLTSEAPTAAPPVAAHPPTPAVPEPPVDPDPSVTPEDPLTPPAPMTPEHPLTLPAPVTPEHPLTSPAPVTPEPPVPPERSVAPERPVTPEPPLTRGAPEPPPTPGAPEPPVAPQRPVAPEPPVEPQQPVAPEPPVARRPVSPVRAPVDAGPASLVAGTVGGRVDTGPPRPHGAQRVPAPARTP